MTAALCAITTAETQLAECEAIISKGFGAFVETGLALLAVRAEKLYLVAGFPSFEAYCKTRWGLERVRAYQICDAAQIAHALPMVVNETQARALKPIPAEERAGAISALGVDVTAARITEHARRAGYVTTPPSVKENLTTFATRIANAEKLFIDLISESEDRDFIAVEESVRQMFIEVESRVVEKHPLHALKLEVMLRKLLSKLEQSHAAAVAA